MQLYTGNFCRTTDKLNSKVLFLYSHMHSVASGVSNKAKTNTNNHEHLIVLVVFMNILLVSNTRYIILWGISA